MGFAAAASKVFRIVALDRGFATEALSRRKVNARGHTRGPGGAARQDLGRAGHPLAASWPHFVSTMVSNNKDKEPWEEEMDEGVNKGEKKIASAKREREAMESKPILVGSVNTGRSFSHNLQGPLPPALSLNSFPCVEEAIRVTDEFCDQYRALRREVEILQEENQRLRRMLEYYSIPITRPPPPHSDNNESLRVLVKNCQTEKLKLKEIFKKREKNPPSPPKE
ncbi:hypothetical protein QYE76_066786 [Lolium multiflorum]|uniref:Uncharacterized protein n=1 Tax=Lolium multiflorum TaxID=4521 RepID=A0AAD8SB81_LOLMU|nr:hypothetical protein QYE76_066786 [Lolium multiflorum]